MGHSLLKWRSVAIVMAIAALVFAIACGSDEPEPAPAVDTAKLIQDAVASAQSASAAGLTRDDVEAIVRQSAEGQLSADDVKAIVDQSVRALPAPEIDVNQLSSLVNSAVADAAPEGVSADEISKIVQAQVSAGLSDTLTRGDIEDLVAQAVEDAVGDQLTADQVTDIVNASLVATNEAIEAAASAGRETPMSSAPPVQVVTSTNFVADWAEIVGGDRVEVFGLLQPGGDPHSFVPGARDVAKVADADVVFTVGLGLEAEWLNDLIRNASADESKVVALGESVDPMEFSGPDPHGHGMAHEDEDEHGDEHEDEHHDEMIMGRLLVADGVEAHLSVIDLTTDDVDSGIFEIAAPNATVYPSPTHRYGIVLARGPEDGDDRIHVFDGGVFLVLHGDHYDLVSEPVSRHSLEIVEEMPVHYVNSHGWTTIFADTSGHVILINEQDLSSSQGDYEPTVIEAGPQHGAALVISEGHLAITIPHPEYLENPDFWNILPEGVEVRTFDNELVFDAGDCHRLHGESHNAHGAVFGCWDGTLFLDAHDGEYESELIPYPADAGAYGEFAIGQYFGHHHSDHFFGQSTLFPDGQCCEQGGVWMVDVEHGEMREVFPEPSAAAAFSSDGETFYMLAADGVLRAFDAHDGELIGTMQLVDPFEMVFGSPSPAMIVIGETLYVADPNGGHVLGVHLDEMEIEEEWEVGGAPSSLAFVGVADSGGAPEEGHDEHEEDEHAHDHGTHDPHFWFDPVRVKIAVNEIAARLSAVDPGHASVYYQNASDYGEQLDELHSWIQEHVAEVPSERRLLVTSHDSLSYLAAAYGFKVVGLVIPSLATHVEPSAEHIAEVIEVVREHEVPAVFGETTVSERLAQAVARETGAELVQLYSGSMGEPGSSGDTYLGMVRTNVERIVAALR